MRRPSPTEPARLRDLPAEADLTGVAELIEAATALPDVSPASRQRIRGRLGRSLASPARRRGRWRPRLSPVLVLCAALVSAGVGGAAVQSMITGRRLQREAQEREEGVGPGGAGPRRARRASRSATSPGPTASPPLLSPELPSDPPPEAPAMESPGAPTPPSSPPSLTSVPAAASAPAPNRIGVPVPRRRASVIASAEVPHPAPPRPKPAAREPPAFTPPSFEAPSPPSPEAALLAEAIRALRRDGDADGALALIDRHRMRFPDGPLAPEAAAVRIEALLKAGRLGGALAELDALPLDRVPGHEAWRVARGELRANAGRWRDAEGDFSLALAGLSDRSRADLAERALWGRAVSRARSGDAEGARADYALYLQRFPEGRFAGQARSALPAPGGPHAP